MNNNEHYDCIIVSASTELFKTQLQALHTVVERGFLKPP